MDATRDLAHSIGVAAACRATGWPRSSFYRRRGTTSAAPVATPTPPPTPVPQALTGAPDTQVLPTPSVPTATVETTPGSHAATGSLAAHTTVPTATPSPQIPRQGIAVPQSGTQSATLPSALDQPPPAGAGDAPGRLEPAPLAPAILPTTSSPRALSAAERQHVLEVLHSERFVDMAPHQVYATLLDDGEYLCSIRTMYRILQDAQEVRERRDQLRRPHYVRPELLATAPNQLWSWDITKLLGPAKWVYFYLYVILDVFSRYVVGWMVAHRESAELARRLIAQTCDKQDITPGSLTIHADRGSAMTSKSVAMLMADLGITKTHSRPHVSNDNPYSESQFKTLKYRPGFPDRFGSAQDARCVCHPLLQWYNREHRHSGLGLLTPEMVHYGRAQEVIAARQQILAAAFAAHPERFVRGLPQPAEPPQAVWINPPKLSLAPPSNQASAEEASARPGGDGASGQASPTDALAAGGYEVFDTADSILDPLEILPDDEN